MCARIKRISQACVYFILKSLTLLASPDGILQARHCLTLFSSFSFNYELSGSVAGFRKLVRYTYMTDGYTYTAVACTENWMHNKRPYFFRRINWARYIKSGQQEHATVSVKVTLALFTFFFVRFDIRTCSFIRQKFESLFT